MSLELAGANALLVPGHGRLDGGGGGSGGGGGIGGSCSFFSALVRVVAVDLMSLVYCLFLCPAWACAAADGTVRVVVAASGTGARCRPHPEL